MTDVLGYRAVFGVLGPSTNTVVQPEMDGMRPAGVTNHYSRITVENPRAVSDESFLAGTMEIDKNTMSAVHSVLTCAPDHLVMGMSAVTFYGGSSRAAKWREKIEREAGVKASIGSESLVAALAALGNIKKVAFLSPYYPVANQEVTRYLHDYGFETVRELPLRCETWLHIAKVTSDQLTSAVGQIDGDDVDALVQVGTNLPMAKLAPKLERSIGKPVIAINTATYWHALRTCGIADRVPGFGRLLEEH